MLKIGYLIWVGSHMATMLEASKQVPQVELKIACLQDLEDLSAQENFITYLEKEADVILVYPTSNPVWDALAGKIEELKSKKPVIAWGSDPSFFLYSSAKPEQLAVVQQYTNFDGLENMVNLLRYLAKEFAGEDDLLIEAPQKVPWQGIYDAEKGCFSELDDYLVWSKEQGRWQEKRPTVGLLFYRSYWLNGNMQVIDALIACLQKSDCNVLPIFAHSFAKPELGAKSNEYIIEKYFLPQGKPFINLCVNMQGFRLLNSGEGEGIGLGKAAQLLARLNVPMLLGIITSQTEEEWRNNPHGLGSAVAWSVAMPEFDGMIEPIVIGARTKEKKEGVDLDRAVPLKERIEYLTKRIVKWLSLQKKKPAERKVVFVLHNKPCAGLEATIGTATNLDSLESVARLINVLQAAGYTVDNPPQDGKQMIETIMERKAIADFRWTPIEEIVEKKGAMAFVDVEQYEKWLQEAETQIRENIVQTWGEPPGQSMVYQNKLVITGVEYGNVLVVTQPKRGCYGARCDGEVCKILHDPQCPPTHQYLASYWYWEKVWGADAIIHVGTHGNLEFLPGKSVGLSNVCYPDLAIGTLPHLYIYSTDNPPEGTIAKRRSYAVLVDHLIPVTTNSGVYDHLGELETLLAEYGVAKVSNSARAHTLEHLIIDALIKANLHKELKITEDNLQEQEYLMNNFSVLVKQAHQAITRVRDTSIAKGLHIFGELLEGERLLEFLAAMLKYDFGETESLRRVILELMDLDYEEVIQNTGEFVDEWMKTNGELLEEAYLLSKQFIACFLEKSEWDYEQLAKQILQEKYLSSASLEKLAVMQKRVIQLAANTQACTRETANLLRGLNGEFIPTGSSGCPTRGRPDILPTGKNFYSKDPYTIPTKAAWQVGKKLANGLLEKYQQEEGKLPENCGMVIFCTDMMWTDGEQAAQILYLLGVEPLWDISGRIKGLRVIPVEELGRPRVDVTVRMGGIVRDCFPMVAELIDKGVRMVSQLEEPLEQNYVRKNSLLNLESQTEKEDWREAMSRVFSCPPGTYGAGVNLAVYASAWKEEKDLADIFIQWSGYAYGEEMFGQEAHEQFAQQVKSIELTFKNNGTDEHDLLGCCGHFSYQGGLTAAAKVLSGKEIKTYHGDTRDPRRPEVVDLADELRRVVRTKLLNPKWIEGMKEHGYKGAGDIAKRVGRVYGWEATTGQVDDWIFDGIAENFVLNEENKQFFEENNPWALEEIGRRLLEAEQRGLWEAKPEILQELKETYLEIEGWLEEKMGDVQGDFQAGSIDILNMDDVADWGAKINGLREKIHKK